MPLIDHTDQNVSFVKFRQIAVWQAIIYSTPSSSFLPILMKSKHIQHGSVQLELCLTQKSTCSISRIMFFSGSWRKICSNLSTISVTIKVMVQVHSQRNPNYAQRQFEGVPTPLCDLRWPGKIQPYCHLTVTTLSNNEWSKNYIGCNSISGAHPILF